MIDCIVQNFWILWAVICLLCLILEMTSGDFYLTCFAVGAVASTLCAAIGLPFWVQVVAFAALSVLSICFLRPRLTGILHKGGKQRLSNTDALIGRIGTVSQQIEAGGYGRVKIDGDDWKATATDNAAYAVGAKVKVVGRESVIITVCAAE